MTTSDNGSYRYPAVAPDGKASFSPVTQIIPKPTRSFEMDLNGSSKILTQCQDGCLSPVISPDGLYIAFISAGDDLMLMNRDGSNPHVVFGPPAAKAWDPAWSPDSQQILFASDKLVNSDQLFRINLAGTHLVQVSDIPGLPDAVIGR